MPNRLGTLHNEPLRKRVIDVLREAILSGELKPGEPLVETELATQLGISRAPLREALQQLSAEGLVEIVPYKGAAVRELHKTDIEELYSLRIVLETFAARRIIELNKPDISAKLHAIYNTMLAAAQAGDITRVSAIDREFHDTLIALSEHSLLQSTWNAVNMRVRQVMALRNRRNTDITIIAHNHLPIIEAIEQGNVQKATELLTIHVSSAGDLVAEGWDTFLEEQEGLP